ncbi:MAG: IS110 family transposase [Anaeromyxobacter sp.]
MDHIGIDLHKKDSQLCILNAEGGVLEVRIPTRADRFAEVLANRPRAKLLLEASTESEWVARHIESFGHEVIVADPNYAPMYGTRTRRVKTDRRDARALAEACRSGTYRAAHRRSESRRTVAVRLSVRDTLVRTRSRFITVTRTSLRSHGLRAPSCEAEHFARVVLEMALPDEVRDEVEPLLLMFDTLNARIAKADADLEAIARDSAVVRRLTTAPGVGVVTAIAYDVVIDDPKRFQSAQQVSAYCGLVPSELSSGEKQRKGRITKTGNARVRWLLVQAAHCVLRSKSAESLPLREWAGKIHRRRGRAVAVVALARKLSGILFAMMRDGKDFDGSRTCRGNAMA